MEFHILIVLSSGDVASSAFSTVPVIQWTDDVNGSVNNVTSNKNAKKIFFISLLLVCF